MVDGFPDQNFVFRGRVEDADDDIGGRVTELVGVEVVAVGAETEAVKKIGMLHLLT